MKKLIILMICCLSGLALWAGNDTRVNILDYKEFVKDAGKDTEDWQPAFEKAIAKAFETSRVLYVPAGTYPIHKTVTIWRDKSSSFISAGFTLVGDGRYASTIVQKNPEQNCIDWTGKTYAGSMNGGTIEKISLIGGQITLNIKWHNQFTMRSCYIGGGKEIGIYNEGYSNRFLDIVVRHCYKIGFLGRAHFNDVTIRDGYFSRCGIGLSMPGGARGVRVSGLGFEHCDTTAIFMQLTLGVTISNCYFECDGFTKDPKELGSSIKLGDRNSSYKITGCIFRGTDARSGQIMIATNNGNGTISDNVFEIHIGEAAFLFVKPQPRWASYKGRLVIRDNTMQWTTKMAAKAGKQVPICYREETAGMIKALIANGCEIAKGTSVVGSEARNCGEHDRSAFE